MRISDWSSDVCSSDLAVAMYRRNHRKRQLAPADAETLKRIRERPPQLQVQREGLCLVRHHGLDIEPGAERRSVAVDNRAAHIATPTQHLLRRQHRLEHRKIHRSEEHTSELQSLMRHSYAVFCLKKK